MSIITIICLQILTTIAHPNPFLGQPLISSESNVTTQVDNESITVPPLSVQNNQYDVPFIAFTDEDAIVTFYPLAVAADKVGIPVDNKGQNWTLPPSSPFPSIKNENHLKSLSGLAVDFSRHQFFYSEYDDALIKSAKFNGDHFQVLASNQKNVYALAFDPIENYLYATVYNDFSIIRLNPYKNLKNSTIPPQPQPQTELVLRLSSNDRFRGIAVDPCESTIYWTNGNYHRPRIQRFFLPMSNSLENARNVESIIETHILYPRGLTLDHETKKLYWGDRDLEKIERTDFDGEKREIILHKMSKDFFGVTVLHDFIYWTDFKNRTVFRAPKIFIGNVTQEIVTVIENVRPRGIVAVVREVVLRAECDPRPNLKYFASNQVAGDHMIFGLGQKNRSLTCTFRTGPKTSVQWIHDGSVILESFRDIDPETNQSESTLWFPKIGLMDQGNYACLVKNGFVQERLNFSIGVCSDCVPRIEKFGEKMILNDGQRNGILICKYEGSLKSVVVKWTRQKLNGGSEENFEPLASEKFDERDHRGESVFRIPLVTKSHRGKYICEVENQFGQDSFTFFVDIVTPPSFADNSSTKINSNFSTASQPIGGLTAVGIGEELVYGLSLAGLVILALLAGLGFLWRKYKMKQEVIQKLTDREVKEFFEGTAQNDPPVDDMVTANDENVACNATALSLPFDTKHEIQLEELMMVPTVILGQGEFGVVKRGHFRGQPVAVKSLKPDADVTYLKGMLSELKIMVYLGDHKAIVKFLGAHTAQIGENIIHVVVELSPMGDLHSFLKKNRTNFLKYDSNRVETVGKRYENVAPMTEKHFLSWSLQIAQGMEYMESKKVIHGDLATRNVLMFDNDVVKISDFGLSKQIYSYTKYCKKSKTPLPFRWLAIESLRFMEFSSLSDVWAFGVTIWEIFSIGQFPYPEFNWSKEFVDALTQGHRLAKPDFATDEIYDQMVQCWHPDPERRPKFGELQSFFHNLVTKHLSFDIGKSATINQCGNCSILFDGGNENLPSSLNGGPRYANSFV